MHYIFITLKILIPGRQYVPGATIIHWNRCSGLNEYSLPPRLLFAIVGWGLAFADGMGFFICGGARGIYNWGGGGGMHGWVG